MTVSKLIEELSKCNPNARVIIDSHGIDYWMDEEEVYACDEINMNDDEEDSSEIIVKLYGC